MESFAALRAHVETLAAALPPFGSGSGYRTTASPGAASRQRSGQGEDFWQYRSQTPEDTAGAIDWRRSATGDELFIREHELQSARLLSLWVDGNAGFDWRSDARLPSKADRARVLLTAIAMRYCETGDMAGVMGGANGASMTSHSPGRMLDDFLHIDGESRVPAVPEPQAAHLILASDFYQPLDDLRSWIEREAGEGRTGILLQVVDPKETDFPYSGRVRFRLPGTGLEKIFGRTETMRDDYLARFAERQDALRTLCQSVGWQFLSHKTSDEPLETAFALLQLLSVEGAG